MAQLRFLLDACVGPHTARALRDLGADVTSMAEIQRDLSDPDILAVAHEECRILVTTDKDFGDLVVRDGGSHCGVLLVRMPRSFGPERAPAISRIVRERGEELCRAFCVFDGERLRVRWHGTDD